MFSGFFWGIILVVLGLLFVIKTFVNIPIPVFRIFLGILFIYWGISIIIGGFSHKEKITFTDTKIKDNKISKEYNAVFGNIDIDLSNIELSKDMRKRTNINVVFGKGKVLLPDNIHIIIFCTSVFGSIKTPISNFSFLGENKIEINKQFDNEPIVIQANAVFGEIEMEIVNRE